MKNIFWNKIENRPRAVWRMAGQLLILVATLMVFDGLTASLDSYLAETLVGVLAFIVSVALAGRWLDKRPLADFGLRLGTGAWWRVVS